MHSQQYQERLSYVNFYNLALRLLVPDSLRLLVPGSWPACVLVTIFLIASGLLAETLDLTSSSALHSTGMFDGKAELLCLSEASQPPKSP
mmetsp:Transcript_26779/g.48260  ORF Transcript_26779/g.48260 Transcript_26779/m.48260 type:complete len:90 (-) Transcript_26779:1093-1362(-)